MESNAHSLVGAHWLLNRMWPDDVRSWPARAGRTFRLDGRCSRQGEFAAAAGATPPRRHTPIRTRMPTRGPRGVAPRPSDCPA